MVKLAKIWVLWRKLKKIRGENCPRMVTGNKITGIL